MNDRIVSMRALGLRHLLPAAPWRRAAVAAALAGSVAGASLVLAQAPAPTGYDDTPFLPGGQWRVHDGRRPRPPVVTPGAEPGAPPSDAIVLFGTDLSGWRTANGGPPKWKVENGVLQVVPGGGDILTREEFGDCQLHVEWATPTPPHGNSQERGNSGVFLMGLYEVQVLDSFENLTYADGQAAALYGQFPPFVNASRPPGEWQAYDIVFEAPRFEGEALASPAYLTVLHNGVLVQNHRAVLGPTLHRRLAHYAPHGPAGPLKLQDHENPVRYRNVWIRRLER